MNYRDIPITKDCDVIKVNGRDIAINTKKRVVSGEERTVSHRQQFQIAGSRVIPCRVYLPRSGFDNTYYLPTIGGVPMDQASLGFTGNVYLNVKFSTVNDGFGSAFIIDPMTPPSIGSTSLGSKVEYSTSGGVWTVVQPWFSWLLGTVGADDPSNMRYFSGSNAFDGIDLEDRPIYRKGLTDPDEWGAAGIGLTNTSAIGSVATGDPFDEGGDGSGIGNLPLYGSGYSVNNLRSWDTAGNVFMAFAVIVAL